MGGFFSMFSRPLTLLQKYLPEIGLTVLDISTIEVTLVSTIESMPTIRKILVTFLITILLLACGVIPALNLKAQPTSLPGWRALVSDLLLEDDALPEGWARIRDLPKDSLTDETINHVYRSWWGKARGDGKADQAIWRAYTIEDGKKQYTTVRQQSMFSPDFTPSPEDLYLAFQPPPEISFRSSIADEFFLACGWLYEAQCYVLARYRNYVTFLSMNLESEYKGYTTVGLTYSEIELVVSTMDAKFAEFLSANPAP